MKPTSNKHEPLFTIRCANRDIFGIGVLAEFCENELLDPDRWAFVVKRAQQCFGQWPVHILGHNEQQQQSKSRFTGYRIIANCSAFDPGNPDIMEKAILIWHQTTACLQMPDPALEQLTKLHWVQFAEATDY